MNDINTYKIVATKYLDTPTASKSRYEKTVQAPSIFQAVAQFESKYPATKNGYELSIYRFELVYTKRNNRQNTL